MNHKSVKGTCGFHRCKDANQDTRCDSEEKLGIHGAITTRYHELTVPEQKVVIGPDNVAEPNREIASTEVRWI